MADPTNSAPGASSQESTHRNNEKAAGKYDTDVPNYSGCVCAWGGSLSVDFVPPPHECDYHTKIRERAELQEAALREIVAFVGRLRGGDRPSPTEVLAHWNRGRNALAGKEPSRG